MFIKTGYLLLTYVFPVIVVVKVLDSQLQCWIPKRVFEAAKLAYATKTKETITSQKLRSPDLVNW